MLQYVAEIKGAFEMLRLEPRSSCCDKHGHVTGGSRDSMEK